MDSSSPLSDSVLIIADKYSITPHDLGRLACDFRPPTRDRNGVLGRYIGLNPYIISSNEYTLWERGYAERAKEIVDSGYEAVLLLKDIILGGAGIAINIEEVSQEVSDETGA